MVAYSLPTFTFLVSALLGPLPLALPLPLGPAPAQHAELYSQAEGQGSYLLGPDRPTLFTFDRGSMSCSVSWGTLSAPGPGPFSEPEMNLERVNFGMIVFSLEVASFQVKENHVTMTGTARSITTVNDDIVENAVYRFTAEAIDGGPAEKDSFSMTLHGDGLMFDAHTFEPAEGGGLVSGDVVIGGETSGG